MIGARSLLLALVIVAGIARAAIAQTPQATIEFSDEATWLGIPIEISIEVRGSVAGDPVPVPPTIANATIEVLPVNTTSFTSIVNGRRSEQRILLYRWRVTPQAIGEMRIPVIRVSVAGNEFTSRERVIPVKPDEQGDELFVEIIADRNDIFVGERVGLKLRIWIKPFLDRWRGGRWRPEDMWRTIDNASRWGVFQPALGGPDGRGRAIDVSQLERKGSDGSTQEYYAFELSRTFWPARPGAIDLGEIAIRVRYPSGVSEQRDFFGTPRTTGARVLTAVPEPSPLIVKPLPDAGRPASFSNAVGQFEFAASALPSEVSVGEPIDVTLTITDRTRGGSDLTALSPPVMTAQGDLTSDFRVASDPLAGDVQGLKKTFRQIIRPLRDSITAIPPIQFSYFDPRTAEYVTLRSEPIPIRVKPGQLMDSASIVDARQMAPVVEGTTLSAGGGGLLANELDPVRLLAAPRVGLGVAPAIGLILPPLLAMGICGVTALRRRDARDVAGRRRRRALPQALARVATARDAAALRAALTDYLADALDRPPGALTGHEADESARILELSDDSRTALRTLLSACEQAQYAASSAFDLEGRRREADAWLRSAASRRPSPALAEAES